MSLLGVLGEALRLVAAIGSGFGVGWLWYDHFKVSSSPPSLQG